MKKFFSVAPLRAIHWIYAMTFESLAIALIIILQITGFFWKPSRQKFSKKTPILLVHGYINTGAVWAYLYWKLKCQDIGPIYHINLKKPFASMLDHAKQVEKMADCIEKETGDSHLILIGHSMGGIISALYATRFARDGKVTEVVTIASPLQGTHVAKIAIGKNAKEMEIGSPLLKTLKQDILQSKIRFSHIASKTDPFVIPQSSAVIRESRVSIFPNLGHGALLFSPRVAKQLIEWMQESLQS